MKRTTTIDFLENGKTGKSAFYFQLKQTSPYFLKYVVPSQRFQVCLFFVQAFKIIVES